METELERYDWATRKVRHKEHGQTIYFGDEESMNHWFRTNKGHVKKKDWQIFISKLGPHEFVPHFDIKDPIKSWSPHWEKDCPCGNSDYLHGHPISEGLNDESTIQDKE